MLEVPEVRVFDFEIVTMDPLQRDPYPETETLYIKMERDLVYVNGVLWDAGRVGAAVLNARRYCGCGRCFSCQVGNYVLDHNER